MITELQISEVAKRLGTATGAERVILFGSYARGVAGENSDVDLLIIAPSGLPRYQRPRNLYKLFQPYPFAMDLLVYTPEEVEQSQRSPISFISRILREGKTVYERRDQGRQTMDD